MHLNSLYDVLGKCFLDAIVSPGTKSGETRAAADMVDSLSDRFPVILTADRNYEQYNLLHTLRSGFLIMSSGLRMSAAVEFFPE